MSTDPAYISPKEQHFMRHALGLNVQRLGYRNRFLAGGADDIAIGRALVARGLAVEGYQQKSGAINFTITLAGFKAVARRGERMDREELAAMHSIDRELARATAS